MQVSHEEINELSKKLMLEKKDFTILESIHQFAPGKLSSIHKCMVKGAEAACKIIRNERINNFIIEGFLEGISKINKIPMR